MQQYNMVPSTFKVRITCQVPQYNSMSHRQSQKGCNHVHKKGKSRQSQKVYLTSLKRMSCDCPAAEELPTGKMHKIREVANDCRQQKGNAVGYEQGILVGLKTHPLDHRTNGNDDLDCVRSSDLAWDDSDSVASSVGSCSDVSSERESFPGHYVSAQCQKSVSYTRGSKPFCASENDGEIHRLELWAYRSTLAALHASGPLSWDKESLLTNLRSTLHISNDEHLMELRYLLSPKSSAYLRYNSQ